MDHDGYAMNDFPYMDVREETNSNTVRTLIQSGWMMLRIYLRKREVQYSDPKEFEEYPVYILGNMKGG